ncbi:hypothetical protein I4U23_027315 [Adineta vaga]|nr:hypothetical protein I4U23_027315 [Adineta vaga]
MFCLLHNKILLFLTFLWSVNTSHRSVPFDVRIDHHKTETTRDLIVNTARPHFSWKCSSLDTVLQRNIRQVAYQIQLHSINLSSKERPFQWDSGRVVTYQSTHVPYTAQTDLLSSTYYCFRVRVWLTNSEESSSWTDWIQFRTPMFNLHDYIINNTDLLWIGSTEINMNELRKEFFVSNNSRIKSAIVYLCGLGYYQFYLNGENVDPSRKLDPGWTTYEKRTLLVSFDVTANITIGMNAVGIKLGNGWYSIEQSGRKTYGK